MNNLPVLGRRGQCNHIRRMLVRPNIVDGRQSFVIEDLTQAESAGFGIPIVGDGTDQIKALFNANNTQGTFGDTKYTNFDFGIENITLIVIRILGCAFQFPKVSEAVQALEPFPDQIRFSDLQGLKLDSGNLVPVPQYEPAQCIAFVAKSWGTDPSILFQAGINIESTDSVALRSIHTLRSGVRDKGG
jgi:hypothetical protein